MGEHLPSFIFHWPWGGKLLSFQDGFVHIFEDGEHRYCPSFPHVTAGIFEGRPNQVTLNYGCHLQRFYLHLLLDHSGGRGCDIAASLSKVKKWMSVPSLQRTSRHLRLQKKIGASLPKLPAVLRAALGVLRSSGPKALQREQAAVSLLTSLAFVIKGPTACFQAADKARSVGYSLREEMLNKDSKS